MDDQARRQTHQPQPPASSRPQSHGPSAEGSQGAQPQPLPFAGLAPEPQRQSPLHPAAGRPHQPQPKPPARRPSRDVLPAFLAAGAVGLAVTLVVGGSTAGIRHVLPSEPSGVAGVAEAPVEGPGIEVAVRPARPPAIAVAPAAPTGTDATTSLLAVPAVRRANGRGAATAVRAPAVERTPTSATPVPAILTVATPEPTGVVALAASAPVALEAAPADVPTEAVPSTGRDVHSSSAAARRGRLAAVTTPPTVTPKPAKTEAKAQAKDEAKAEAKADRKAAKEAAKADRKAAKHRG